tara:strand:- start:619 stop:870 length:252 start_codon:yes stop_codon:yes gene_type:complete
MEAWQIWAHLLQQEAKVIDDQDARLDALPAVLFFLSVLIVGLMVEVCSPREPATTWHERYVSENCERCEQQGEPCCVYVDAAP